MTILTEMLRRVVTGEDGASWALVGAVSPNDVKRILEIACLAVASDGHIADEELTAVRVLGSEVASIAGTSKSDVSEEAVASLAHACVSLGTRDDRLERLRTAAA